MGRIKIYSWMRGLGILGFLGFLYFVIGEPLFLLFFCFFGFFSFGTFAKYLNVKKDEMFLLHQNKATHVGLRVFTVSIFCGIIFIEVFLKWCKVEYRYAIMVALISASFAASFILFAVFLEYYERTLPQLDEENED